MICRYSISPISLYLCLLNSYIRDELDDVRESQEEKVDFSSMQTANMKIVLEQNQKFRKGKYVAIHTSHVRYICLFSIEIVSLKEKCKVAI